MRARYAYVYTFKMYICHVLESGVTTRERLFIKHSAHACEVNPTHAIQL